MDGNHKLILWGMVIHGCIDGCSRNIIYLQLRDNNKSYAVLDVFMEGVSQYQLPLNVSGDFGEDEEDDVEVDPRFSAAEGDELLHSVVCNHIECPLSDIKLQEFRQREEHISPLLIPFSELGEKYRLGLL